MSLEHRLARLEQKIGNENHQRTVHVVLCGSRPIREEDRGIIDELVRARVRASWPFGLLTTEVTGDDVEAWRAERQDEAIRGIGHRRRGARPPAHADVQSHWEPRGHGAGGEGNRTRCE